MATSSPEVTAIGVAQATGTVAAAAVLVYVVSLYCGAGYLDLPFETRRSKVVLGIDFETDMRACFQAFHPNARVLNMNIGLHNVVDVIRAIRELVPPGARLHLNACLPCNHSSGTSGKRKHYLTQYHVVVLYDIVQLLDPLYALTWFSENINAAAFKDPMKRLFPSAQHVVMCSSHFSCERRTRAYFASGSPIDLRALHCLKNAGGTVRSCFSLPDGVYEMKSASTKYLEARAVMEGRECSIANAHHERIVLAPPRWNSAPMAAAGLGSRTAAWPPPPSNVHERSTAAQSGVPSGHPRRVRGSCAASPYLVPRGGG